MGGVHIYRRKYIYWSLLVAFSKNVLTLIPNQISNNIHKGAVIIHNLEGYTYMGILPPKSFLVWENYTCIIFKQTVQTHLNKIVSKLSIF